MPLTSVICLVEHLFDISNDRDGDDADLVGCAGQPCGKVLRSSRQLITMMEALAGDWEAGAAKLKRLFRRGAPRYRACGTGGTVEGRDSIMGGTWC